MSDKKHYKQKQKPATAWNIVSGIFIGILLVSEGLTLLTVWALHMLPEKYFAIVAGLVLLVDLPIIISMFPKRGKWQKSTGTGKRITAYLFTLVIAVGCYFGLHATNKLDETFDAITKQPEVSAQVGVFVMAEDAAAQLADTAEYTFAITNSYDEENTAKTLEVMETDIGASLKTMEYPSVFEMVNHLYSGESQAMVLNLAYLSIFHDMESYATFEEKTRMIYQYDILTEPEEKEEESLIPEKTDNPVETPFLMYLSGSDTRDTMLTASRSDVNILAAVNPVSKEILLINTPRDYFIPNPAYGGALDKLTHCGLSGMENSMDALSMLYDQPVAYSAQINFTGFETLIDAIGGINIYSEIDDGVYLRQGNNEMDGELALEFARDRYSYAAGDNARGVHQMQVIQAVVKKLTSGSIITNYSDILDSLQGMFATDMPSDVMAAYIKMQLNDMAQWHITSYAVSGTGGSDQPAAMGGMYAYVMYPDDAMVVQASQLIDKVMAGETITPEDIATEE